MIRARRTERWSVGPARTYRGGMGSMRVVQVCAARVVPMPMLGRNLFLSEFDYPTATKRTHTHKGNRTKEGRDRGPFEGGYRKRG